MNKLNNYIGYIIIIVFYLLINFWILHKWTAEYSNNFAGGVAIPFIGTCNIILNIAFFIGFLIAGIVKKNKRKLYLITAFFALIPIGILIITG